MKSVDIVQVRAPAGQFVIDEHAEEGIRNITNCVACHRSAREEAGGCGGRERREDD